MERLEFIEEAKKRDYSDWEIQELLKLYDEVVQKGTPIGYDALFGMALRPSEVDTLRATA
jgi:hypothetical protein